MPKGVYPKRFLTWERDRKTVTNKEGFGITENQMEIFLEAIENDYTINEACAAAKFSYTTYRNHMLKDEDFKMRVEWAKSKLIRDAKDKVHRGVEKDETGEFSLKVLKARCPEQYNTQKIETKNEIEAKVETRDVDAMLVEYYSD